MSSICCLQTPLVFIQLHDQVNNRLHNRYEEKKDNVFSEICDISKECFITILEEIWEEWVTLDQLIKAGKGLEYLRMV